MAISHLVVDLPKRKIGTGLPACGVLSDESPALFNYYRQYSQYDRHANPAYDPARYPPIGKHDNRAGYAVDD